MGGTGLKEGREVQAEEGPESAKNAERAFTRRLVAPGKVAAWNRRNAEGEETAREDVAGYSGDGSGVEKL